MPLARASRVVVVFFGGKTKLAAVHKLKYKKIVISMFVGGWLRSDKPTPLGTPFFFFFFSSLLGLFG